MWQIWNRRPGTLLVVAAILCATSGEAQDTLHLAVGQRVRIAPYAQFGPRATGELLDFDAQWVLVRSDSAPPVRYDLRQVRRIEVSLGRQDGSEAGAIVGLVIGFAGGAVVGLKTAPYSLEECPDFPTWSELDLGTACSRKNFVDGVWVLAAGVVGAFPLGFVGALIGTPFHHEGWQELKPERVAVRVSPFRRGRLAVGLSVAF